MRDTISLGITGASGLPYALALLKQLVLAQKKCQLMLSKAARQVAALEMQLKIPANTDQCQQFFTDYSSAAPDQLQVFGHEEWTAPLASGSSAPRAMVICPCSSGCLSAIASGASDNLIERAADVMIKEKRQLILVPRETPLSAIHLENMLKLAKLGVEIIPASPGFYHQPKTIDDLVDFVVARILDHLDIPNNITQRWAT